MNSSISSFRRLPLAFICSILLLLCIEIGISQSSVFWIFCSRYAQPSIDDGVRLESILRTMPEDGKKTTIFLTGSSQMREDIDLHYLGSELKQNNAVIYNLGIYGATPIEMYMLRNKLLAKRPDIIVYIAFAGTFYDDYQDNDFQRMKYYFSPAVMPFFIKHLGTKTVIKQKAAFIDSSVGMLSSLYKYRDSIGRQVLYAFERLFSPETEPVVRTYAYSESLPESYFIKEIEIANGQRFSPKPYSKMAFELFSLFAKDAVTNGSRFIYINGPTHPRCKELYKKEVETEYDSILSHQAAEIGFTYLSERDLPTFEENEFIDFTHLNEAGRAKFSDFLKKELRKRIPQEAEVGSMPQLFQEDKNSVYNPNPSSFWQAAIPRFQASCNPPRQINLP